MTGSVGVESRSRVLWRRTPAIALGFGGAVVLAAVGIASSRPDVAAIGLPLALSAAWMLLRRPERTDLRIRLKASAVGTDAEPAVRATAGSTADADWLQVAIDQDGRRRGLADVRPGPEMVRARSRLLHSGPSEPLAVVARGVCVDGAWISEPTPRIGVEWTTPPVTRRVAALPVAPHLSGLHGAHEGSRAGHGGDFRDIHPFAPGDELRRVDWRATARAARQPGDLLVRRYNALSDSSVVVAVDTAEDLGAVVAGWGAPDLDTSGPTSLDLAREAALSIATSAVEAGDRIAYHALARDGRSVPAGGGARHLARLRGVIAATGQGEDDSGFRRTPVVPSGSIVFVLSTFFDGTAAQLATRWRAAGHAVVAVDVLPLVDTARLSREQRLALRTVLAERADILSELRRTGVEVVSWAEADVDTRMRLAALRQRGMRTVRR